MVVQACNAVTVDTTNKVVRLWQTAFPIGDTGDTGDKPYPCGFAQSPVSFGHRGHRGQLTPHRCKEVQPLFFLGTWGSEHNPFAARKNYAHTAPQRGPFR